MPYLLMFMMSIAISMALTALLARHAVALGMIDRPDSRKVHSVPVPRVGGVGIVVGALIPILLWLPTSRASRGYVLGAAILLVFGVWDDRKELGHYVKFVGQFAAAAAVVYYGGLYVSRFPFLGLAPLAPEVAKPFTVFAIIGMINAINHSDGLDGLAGGLSLLSLGCIAYLASLGGGDTVIAIAAASAGGVFGFLRYNTYPARVFMGDGGSQFLGLTLGYLAVLLIQRANTALSAALPLLFLGLPIADILGVFWQRVHHGLNWFRATKNHLHHRLLMLGLHHYESVVLIYTIQIGLVIAAVLMRYQSDTAIIAAYLGACALIYGCTTYAERTGRHAHRGSTSRLADSIARIKSSPWMTRFPGWMLWTLVPAGLVGGSLLSIRVAPDIGVVAIGLLALLVLSWTVLGAAAPLATRFIVYVDAASISYLTEAAKSPILASWESLEYAYFAALLLSLAFMVRFAQRSDFAATPTDYLTIAAVGVAALFPTAGSTGATLTGMLVKGVILFYACEYILNSQVGPRRVLGAATALSLGILALRGVGVL